MQQRKPDWVDAILLMNRQFLILNMYVEGKVDAEEAGTMFEATETLKAVEADRKAAETNKFGPGTPSGQLVNHFYKRKAATKESDP